MKDRHLPQHKKASVGSRIIASLKEAVAWVEGKHVEVRVTTVEVPIIDGRSTRRILTAGKN